MANTDPSRTTWGKGTVCLLVAYILCGMVLSMLPAGHSWTRPPFSMVVGSQWYLLLVWAWLGTPSLRTRVVGLIVGAVYLAILRAMFFAFSFGLPSRPLLSTVQLAFTLSVANLIHFALMLGLLRLTERRKIDLVKDRVLPSEDRFQYSIRHVLWLTTIVAIVLALGQVSRSYFTTSSDSGMRGLAGLVGSILSIPCSALLVFTSAWAGFGSGSLLPRTAILCFLSVAVNLLFPYYFPHMDHSPLRLVTDALVNVFVMLLVVAWLSVFRSRGYRFVRSQGLGL